MWQLCRENLRPISQELNSVSKQCEALGLNLSGNFEKAQQVAAEASAVSSTGILLTVLHSEQLITGTKKQKISQNLAKMKEQSRSYGFEVEGLMHPAIFNAATRWLLKA